MKHRQYNDEKKKGTNNDLQNTTQTNIWSQLSKYVTLQKRTQFLT